ncbi:unnamed protein product [Adineta steineri]|uniref:Transcription initiation factor IIE subunit alpha N-terminal domain-containing protein n=1 Tax=Adineta steineri TaxID=433720 RepID=A0A814R3V0_9BILA|nr:unnamed protein product [Adineta steineri]CAF1128469.1 unnamed protein product [Adineta steineri]
MSSTASAGGSFSNMNSSLPLPTKPNPHKTSSSSDVSLPVYDTNDPQAILRALIRFIMRTFYEVPKSLVIEYIYHHKKIKQQDLADRLCLDPKVVRGYIQEFKRDKFIIEDHRLESNDGTTGRRSQDQYYYKFDRETFINVVRYRLIHMRMHVENFERQQTYKQTNYECEQCAKEYTELDIGKLYDLTQDTLICLLCGGVVHEDVETNDTTNRQTISVSLFNEQMKPIYKALKQIDNIIKNEQQMKDSSDHDLFQQNGNSSLLSSNHSANREGTLANTNRSHASNVFDRTTAVNHEIQIVIERDDDDDDDYYSQMDIDGTSNTYSLIGSSRDSGKLGRKSNKPVQSTAEVTTQSLSLKMKLASKKVPSEPKTLPEWFIHSTVHTDHDEEHHRLNNLSLNSTTKPSGISRQLSNQKLVKSPSLNDIKQMLLMHESRRGKILTLTTMADYISPRTSIQMAKTTNSQ